GLFPGQNADIFESGAFAVFLVAEFDAIRPVYGDRAGDFTLIEAGLMSQLLEEEAMKAGLGLCQIGAMDFGRLREGFRLKESHSYLHCLVGGLVARPEGWVFTQASRESLPDQGTAPAGGADALKAALHAWLPDYMVPQTLVQLEAIPLTANGKVDRKALLRLAESGRRGAGYVAPEQGGETLLAGLIGAILGREKVSVLDNFFDLGATSLQLVLFQRRVNEALGRDVPITDIFAHPNIRELNAFLSAGDGADGDGEAVLDEAEKRACLRRRMRKDARRRTHAWDQE
ncbi:MAG: nitroreductase family protein, partial [Desulfovibrio sp.]|nr:nitroreductase family protein [Desulfovibrio sp.]